MFLAPILRYNHQMNITHPFRRLYPWLIWSLAAIFYAYEFFQRVSPNIMVPELMHAFHVQAAGIGLMGSCFYWAYVIMQIPAGLLVDRFGAHKLLSVAIISLMVGTFLLSISTNIYLASAARGLIGFGSSFAFVCTLKLITRWFPATKFALLAGLTQFIGYMGASLGGAPLSYVVHQIGWRASMSYTAVFGAILATAVILVIRERPKQTIKEEVTEQSLDIVSSLKTVSKKSQTWLNGLYACFMMGPTSVFAALWGVPYLVNVNGLSHQIAAGATSMIFFGVAFGSPCFGWLSDKLQLRRSPLIYAAIGALIVTSTILYWHNAPIWAIYGCCFLFGFFQSAHVLNFAIAHEINNPKATGAAIGITNMLTVIGGALFQPLVGLFLVLGWHGLTNHGIAIYSLSNYQWSLSLLPAVQCLALIIAVFLLKETHCRPKKIHKVDTMCTQI